MGFLRRSRRTSLEQVTAMVESYELPTFPQIVATALQELADPEVSLSGVAELLERDPGVSVHLLRLANSAAMGLRSSVDSLDRAVVMLGRNQVESILISRAVNQSLLAKSTVVDPARFWNTAAMRAVVAAELAVVLDPIRRSEHFTGALLQDMALLVLADEVDGYEGLLSDWYDGSITDLAEAEVARFGWDHAAVGGAMCRVWNFPDNLIDSVANHHRGDDPRSPTQLVEGWHETDLDRGRQVLEARAAGIEELEGRLDELLSRAEADAAHVAAAFISPTAKTRR